MTEIRIDKRQALKLLQEAVAEKGVGFVYEPPNRSNCQYQHDGAPGCIVGHALLRAGLTADELEAMDMDRESDSTEIGCVRTPARLHMTVGATRAFSRAQDLQDRGRTWGEAVGSAVSDA